jgi:Sec-independent protein secretion pathway component TatC
MPFVVIFIAIFVFCDFLVMYVDVDFYKTQKYKSTNNNNKTNTTTKTTRNTKGICIYVCI